MPQIRRSVIHIDGGSIAVRQSGSSDRPAFILLHGWPQSSRAFVPLMQLLQDSSFLVAPDLPGVAGSRALNTPGDKVALARVVRQVIRAVGARAVVLVGHDVGGMTAFSYLREFGMELDGAAILNTVIPGVSPWEKVIANPHIWHFAFHAIPGLPETVVAGHQRAYFDYFFDALAHDKTALAQEARDAYASDYMNRSSLRAGFEWYRAFADDAKRNQVPLEVQTPVLYVRGEQESGDIADYVRGLKAAGLTHLTSRLLPKCGHFSLDEAPHELARVLEEFRRDCDHDKRAEVVAIGARRR